MLRRHSLRIYRVLSPCLALCVIATGERAVGVDLIGYLPHYRMNSTYNTGTLPAQLAMLDEIRYFGLTAASNGTVTSLGGSGNMTSHLNRIATIKSAIELLPVADRPRLNITLGGAGEAANFATVAASSTLRDTFAQSIESLLDQTGATSVDIDWEHPDAGIQRTTHYPAMLARIKQEVGTNRRVHATVDPTVVIPSSVFSGPNAIDGLSLMTYDLGWWGNDPGNPNQAEHSLPEYAADSVEAWTEAPGSPNDRPWVFGIWGNNAPEDKLGIGLPFYGHTVTSPDTTYTYEQLVAGGTTTDGNYYTYAGRSVWLPGPDLAAQRVEYAHEQRLQHVIIWEIGQDLHPSNANSLLRAAYEMQQSLAPLVGDYNDDGKVDSADYVVWRREDGSEAGYEAWRANFGNSAAGGGASTSTSVPEPQCFSLAWIFGILLFARHQLFRS